MIILDVQCVQSPLKSSAPVFDNEEASPQEDLENAEASNSLNNTFDVDISSKGKKRALIEQNSVEKDVSPAKRVSEYTFFGRIKNLFILYSNICVFLI